jgi:hypothetical protein
MFWRPRRAPARRSANRLLSAGRARPILTVPISARPSGPFRAANLRRPAGRHSNHIGHLFRQRRGPMPSCPPGDHWSVGPRPFDAFLSAARFYPRRPHASAGSPDSVLPLFFAPTMLRLADNVLGLRTGPHHSVPRYCSLRLYKSCPQAPTAYGPVGSKAAVRRPKPESGCYTLADPPFPYRSPIDPAKGGPFRAAISKAAARPPLRASCDILPVRALAPHLLA